jgi:hypothetical protein
MKKQILNLGKALNKAEQKEINGGYKRQCIEDPWNDCYVLGLDFCCDQVFGFCVYSPGAGGGIC